MRAEREAFAIPKVAIPKVGGGKLVMSIQGYGYGWVDRFPDTIPTDNIPTD